MCFLLFLPFFVLSLSLSILLSPCLFLFFCFLSLFLYLPPGTKPIHEEIILGELIFVQIHAGPVFALARKQENIFEGSLSAY